MSDYLGNLVTRSVGPVEGVRPRLAALFESPPGMGTALLGAGGEAEPAAVAADPPVFEEAAPERAPERQPTVYPALARAPAAPIIRQVALPPVPPALAAPHVADDAIGDMIGRAAPQAPSVPMAPALTPAPIAPAEHSLRQPDRAPAPLVPLDRGAPDEQREQRGAAAGVARDSHRERLIERIMIERNVPVELRSANAAAPTAAQRPELRQPMIAAAAPAAQAAVSQLTPPLIVRAEPPAGLIARPLPAAVSVQPRVPTYGEPVEPTSAAPPPIIQVTIGRIDVRATPAPAAPAQRQRATPPVMGLDDYLRQRAKRGSG
jgi:hypothetical protein